jgi:hypothetical protein
VAPSKIVSRDADFQLRWPPKKNLRLNYEKEILNSDGQQFHHYQQKQQSPLILTELTEHKQEHDI